MKGTRRYVPLVGAAMLGGLLGGCNKDSSNPEAVTVTELKYPGNLDIIDHGGGAVTLTWTASNNEKDFDGFNVYGMKAADATAKDLMPDGTDYDPEDQKSIQLLGDDGKELDGAKAALAKFDFDPATGKRLEVAGAVPAAAASSSSTGSTSSDSSSSSDAPAIQALPIHNVTKADATKNNLPSCRVNAPDMKCVLTTDDKPAKSVGDDATAAANGTISFDMTQVDKLAVGSTYCFLVMSSEKGGTKVSQTSSNIACVTPQYAWTGKLDLSDVAKTMRGFDLTSWVNDHCSKTSDDTCPAPASDTPATTDVFRAIVAGNNGDVAGGTTTSPLPLYFNYANSAWGLIAGKGAGINDLGYYATGFSEALPPTPKFSLDSSAASPIFNGGGYTLAGQTIPLKLQHMYAVATPDSSKYRYVLVYFSAETDGKYDVEIRLPRDAQ